MNKAFCPVCMDDMRYKKVKSFVNSIDGSKTIKYKRVDAVCKTCGEILYVPKIHDKNIDSYNKAVKRSISNEVDYE